MNLIWLSPGLPADRDELAGALPPHFSVLSAGAGAEAAGLAGPTVTYGPEQVDALPVGSLCVATVFETDLLARLAHRPAGVRLLVVGPEGQLDVPPVPPGGRAPDLVAPAASIGDLAIAVQHSMSAFPGAPGDDLLITAPFTPFDAAATAGAAPPVGSRRPPWRGSKLLGAGAVLAGLAIGGIVLAATEGSSSAGPNRTAFNGPNFGGNANGNQFPGNGGQGLTGNGGTGSGTTGNGGTGPGGTSPLPGTAGIPGDRDGDHQGAGGFDRDGDGRFGAGRPQLLACLQEQGVDVTGAQRPDPSDPTLRAAFQKCLQTLGKDGTLSQFPGRP